MIRRDECPPTKSSPRLSAAPFALILLLGAALACSPSVNGADWELSSGCLQQNDLYGVWGSGPDDVFAVGAVGTIVHYDGVSWSVMTSGTTDSLRGVSGSGPNDVFTVGSTGTILHYDGAGWSAMTSGTGNHLYGVWSSGPNDVFAVGSVGTIVHYDGADWSAMTSGTSNDLRGVWGSGPNDVFAVGLGGTIVHYDGADWSPMVSGTGYDLRGVWGSGPNAVLAAGRWNELRSYDGTAWSPTAPPDLYDYAGVGGSGPNDVYAVGQCVVDGEINQYAVGVIRHDTGSGSSVRQTAEYPIFNGVWASGPNDVFVVGNGGSILHWDGSDWSEESLGVATTNLLSVWGTSSMNVFAVGGFQTAVHYDGADWSRLRLGPHHVQATSYAVWGGPWGDGMATYAWVVYEPAPTIGSPEGWILRSFGGDFENDLEGPGNPFDAGIVLGVAQCATILVGKSGAIRRYCSDPDHDEWGWSSMPSGTSRDLHDIWGDEADLYVVGDAGTLLHHDGVDWTTIASGTAEDLRGVWASSPNDWFAVGSGGTILHNDGTDWSPLASGTTENLNDVWGSGPNDVFAVGDNGTALHYDGSTWSSMTSGTTADLNGLWGSGVNDVFAVGDNGTILRYHHLKITVEIPRPDLGSVAVYYGRDSYGVTLTPRASANARFSHWTGDVPTGQEADDPMTMALEHDSTVTAVFIEQYDLTVLVDGEGSVDPNGGTYDEGTQLVLTATPAEGWRFVEWQGDMPGPANPAALTMSADKTITAVFVERPPASCPLPCLATPAALTFLGMMVVMTFGLRRRSGSLR